MSFPISEIGRYVFLYMRQTLSHVRAGLLFLTPPTFILTGSAHRQLLVAPTDLKMADPLEAEDLLQGHFSLAGDILETGGHLPFSCEMPSPEFLREMAQFSWLRHLRTQKSEATSIFARTVVMNFLRHHRRANDETWKNDVMISRINAWLSHSTIILKGADATFYRRYVNAIARHENILRRRYRAMPRGETKLQAAIALCMAAICMDLPDRRKQEAAKRLDDELARQVLPDGGHIARSPQTLLDLLFKLLPLRQTYINLDLTLPKRLVPTIDRIYPALSFFRHRDGDLALFNATGSVLATTLSALLRYDETAGASFKALPHTGYHRLQANKTVLIADTGTPLSTHLSKTAHAGALSFEMSAGQNRFIVNAGFPLYVTDETMRMARSTAAHSAATINDLSSIQFSRSRYLGPVAIHGITRINVERNQNDKGDDTLSMWHNGYAARFGLNCHRTLTLSADGSMITGSDSFHNKRGIKPSNNNNNVATVRFHLHPSIWTMRESSDTIFLTAPDNESWIFCAPGLIPELEDDVFFAASAGTTSSQQITISFVIGQQHEIHWHMKRLS